MPLYSTRCLDCTRLDTCKLSFQDYERVASSEKRLNCGCGGELELVFDPSAVSFVLRDGEAGGWITKATRENKYRAAHRQVMERRQRDHVSPKRLVPNHNGEIAASWAEAKDAAYQSTYARVKRERGAGDAARAALASAKTYDSYLKRET